MIRIRKHLIAPESLANQTSWTGNDVLSRLKADQYGKCYLCERTQVTDFQVEHHKSRDGFPELKYEWTNLFWSCSYCNSKKSSSFDNLLNPIEDNVEDMIRQTIDFPNARALFVSTGNESEEVESTVALLDRIFNGRTKIRTIREQQFYDYAISKITTFQETVISWLNDFNEESRKAIVEELDITSEFLGFKYWIIKSNPILTESFGQYIRWHKA